ncbi:MAG TPA: response regulator [Stellaceae bacterium]
MNPAPGASILVVDDDEGGRYAKAHTLAREGYAVSEAGCGEEALEQIARAAPDLVLMDVRLPDGDGVEFCRRIKATSPQIALLQTSSALISAQDRALALEAGADSYLIEPIEPDELIAVVRALLRMRHAEQSLRQMNDALEAKVVERTSELAESHRRLMSEQAGRREAESILWHTQKLEAIGQLTGGIAHDFNNLLTIVTGNLELLETVLASDRPTSLDRQRRLIHAALRAVQHGAQMTQQLLTFARQGVLHEETVDINATIIGMADFLRRTLGDVVDLEFLPAPGLWLSLIDPAQFEAAILNLAINARDAMPDGGRLTIELGNAVVAGDETRPDIAPGSYVRVDMTDNGAGMDEDVAKRAFEPFFTTKSIGKGSGLGLSQVYGFVSQSGGAVRIASTVGRGTAVTLYLPRSASAIAQTSKSLLDSDPRGDETILVVEDDEQVRSVAVAMVEELGYRVVTAANGAEALAHLKASEPIDLLFSDILMPGGMTGVALATQARKLRRGLAVLLTSGYAADARADLGSSGFLLIPKPYRRGDLAEMLRMALDTPRQGVE